ncbi:MAG: PDZ domain-containing protein [Pirellulales bacterium]
MFGNRSLPEADTVHRRALLVRERVDVCFATRRTWRAILRCGYVATLVAGWCGSGALAQPALEELERTLPPASTAAEDADRVAAPRDAGYLGLIADDSDQIRGVHVLEPVAAGPAAAADFRPDDLIVAAGGEAIVDLDDLTEVLDRHAAGDKLDFDVVRGAEQIRLTATLGRRPEPRRPPTTEPAPAEDEPADQVVHRRLLGVRAVDVDEATRLRDGLPDARGAVVAKVFADSPAAAAQLPVGAVILTLDDGRVDNALDLARRVAAAGAGREVEIGYFWNGALRRQKIVLAGESPLPAAAPPAQEAAKPPAAAGQLDALERRLDELDRRLERIEALLERALGTPDAIPSADDSSSSSSSSSSSK